MMKSKGLTLIELLVVVAVMAILATIAYPLYTDQLRKSRRYDAEGVLTALANVMEQDLARTPNTGYSISDISSYSNLWSAVSNYYDFAVTLGSTSFSYQLTATPKGAQAGDPCGELSLAQDNTRGASQAGCWK